MEYRTFWVRTRGPEIRGGGDIIEIPEVGVALKELSRDGWALLSLAEGTLADTRWGFIVTVQRPRSSAI